MSSDGLFSTKNTLFIAYRKLPQKIKDFIDNDHLRNNTCVPHFSEFEPSSDSETWESTLTRSNLDSYYKDQVDTNDFKGSMIDFIKEYGLDVDVWLIEQIEAGNLSLNGVDKILIELKW